MNRTLVVIRHAKSDWSHDVADDQRPLNPRGRREAPLIGQWVAEHVGAVDLVLCSTAVRARETFTRSGLATGEVRYDERVYAASHQDLMSVVDEVPDDLGTVALVGHNPGLSELVGVLTGEPVELKTSAIAVVSWRGGWPDVWARGASLVSHATPRG
ncbi:SixA phosphatase family protein [Actinophytocola sp. NPDC049390]|uniref:SixA phosphatase family protein n=1 Tax=Actinophytocola sp. NPDC049390 TaxID=3363894 RepID=UPI0037874520